MRIQIRQLPVFRIINAGTGTVCREDNLQITVLKLQESCDSGVIQYGTGVKESHDLPLALGRFVTGQVVGDSEQRTVEAEDQN